MATVMLLHWPETTLDQYDQVRERVQWDSDVPNGVKLHISGSADDGLHILDVWESEEAFNAFFEQRIMPAVQEVGIQGQPDVKFYPLHGVFVPALGMDAQKSDL
jgi:hypothetical protein